MAILNIQLWNPKKSSDFINICEDFPWYTVKSMDFINIYKISSEIVNICNQMWAQIVYSFLVLEDSSDLSLLGS